MKIAEPNDFWPEGRLFHTTAIISDPLLLQQHTVMVVIGGAKLDQTIVNDSWIYDYTMKTWQQVHTVHYTILHVYLIAQPS